MPRRSYDWNGVAEMARGAGGVWRLHPDLVAVDSRLFRHVRVGVPALRPDEGGRFEYARSNIGVDIMGKPVFDLFIRYVSNEEKGE